MSKERDERRFKLIRLDTQDVLMVLFNWKQFESVSLPVFGGIPADAKASNVSFDYRSNAIVICLEHETFDPVPAGHEIPFIVAQMSMETVQLPKTYTNQRTYLITGVESTFGTADALSKVNDAVIGFELGMVFPTGEPCETPDGLGKSDQVATTKKKGWEFLGAP